MSKTISVESMKRLMLKSFDASKEGKDDLHARLVTMIDRFAHPATKSIINIIENDKKMPYDPRRLAGNILATLAEQGYLRSSSVEKDDHRQT